MEYHLVILVHGLWGNLSHFNYVKDQLEDYFNKESTRERLIIYKTGSNQGYKTYDGIDICGKRVASEIEIEIERLNQDGRVVKLSVIGYSLGGLISRYAIGILYYKHYFDTIEPVNFTTFCTPHVGSLTPGGSISIRIFNWLVPFLLANTGKQMFLLDKAKAINGNTTPLVSRDNSHVSLTDWARQNEQPLLQLMANPASIFYKSLKLFKYRSLYSNVVNDKRTSWWTAGISMMNMFEALDVDPRIKIDRTGVINFHNGNKFKFSFLGKQKPLIIDINKPVKIVTCGVPVYTESSRNPIAENIMSSDREPGMLATDIAENFFKRKFKWIMVLFNIFIYAPLWLGYFIIPSLIQKVTSGFRVLRESDAGQLLELYQLVDDPDADDKVQLRPSMSKTLSQTYENLEKNIEQNLEDQTDELMESVWDAMMSKKIYNEDDAFWFNHNSKDEDLSFDKEIEQSDMETVSIPLSDLNDGTYSEKHKLPENIAMMLDNFKLNFNSPAQYDIIKNLNQLQWKKFPIYIQLTNSTHAAAIVRHRDKNFKEGEIIVRQYIEEVFKLT